MKILAVGDMHLGRNPSRLPAGLTVPARELGPAEAWRRTVDAALAKRVKAVLLAGDVVEKDDDFFEAYRELHKGVQRLAEAGIAVLGVAGNHDVRVLPRLAEQIPQFRLLGKGGKWERREIGQRDSVVSLWGWSFPQAQVRQSPLEGVRLARGAGVNLGLLHCDRGVASSPYAPVTNSALEQAGLDGWLLGHIHKPDDLAAPSPNGYLGSLTGLDRSETGPRGPWLLTVEKGQITGVEQLPLAPLRWEHLEVPLDGLGTEDESSDEIKEEVQGRLLARVQAFDKKLNQQGSRATAVGLHIRFTGRTRFGTDAIDAIPVLIDDKYFIASLQADTRPEEDLQELAQHSDPLGLLAQRLLWLEQPIDAKATRLIENARQKLEQQAKKARWGSLDDIAPDPVEWLRKAGFRVLDQLSAQKAGDS